MNMVVAEKLASNFLVVRQMITFVHAWHKEHSAAQIQRALLEMQAKKKMEKSLASLMAKKKKETQTELWKSINALTAIDGAKKQFDELKTTKNPDVTTAAICEATMIILTNQLSKDFMPAFSAMYISQLVNKMKKATTPLKSKAL